MNTLSLNINGLGKGDFKISWVSNLILKHKINFACIQETKRKKLDNRKISKMWGSFDFDYAYQSSVGQGGGLVSIWNKDLFHKKGEIIQRDCIIVHGVWKEGGQPICFVNIYASQNPSIRADLWNTITSFLTNWEGLYIVCGDFNDVRNSDERRGSFYDSRASNRFNQFIHSNQLIDVKIGGCSFTWANKTRHKA